MVIFFLVTSFISSLSSSIFTQVRQDTSAPTASKGHLKRWKPTGMASWSKIWSVAHIFRVRAPTSPAPARGIRIEPSWTRGRQVCKAYTLTSTIDNKAIQLQKKQKPNIEIETFSLVLIYRSTLVELEHCGVPNFEETHWFISQPLSALLREQRMLRSATFQHHHENRLNAQLCPRSLSDLDGH